MLYEYVSIRSSTVEEGKEPMYFELRLEPRDRVIVDSKANDVSQHKGKAGTVKSIQLYGMATVEFDDATVATILTGHLKPLNHTALLAAARKAVENSKPAIVPA